MSASRERLAFLTARNKRLFLQLQDVSFSETVLTPDYLQTDTLLHLSGPAMPRILLATMSVLWAARPLAVASPRGEMSEALAARPATTAGIREDASA
jgi:hypothetical protein